VQVVGPPNEAAGIGDRLEIAQLAQIHMYAWHGFMYHTLDARCTRVLPPPACVAETSVGWKGNEGAVPAACGGETDGSGRDAEGCH
jgi:hypothetical protein